MSRTSLLPAIAICSLALLLPHTAAGQTTEELRARVVKLQQMWEEAKRAEADELTRIDTVRAGPLTGVTRPEHEHHVAELLQAAWDSIADDLGSDTLVVVERLYAYDLPGDVLDGDSAYLSVSTSDEIVRDVHRRLKLRLDPTGHYVDMLPFQPLDRARRAAVYVELVTAPSRSARACYLGDIASCRDALELSELSDPIAVWYSPAEQRRLVEERNWASEEADRVRACSREGSDDACHGLLTSVPAGVLAPFGEHARRLLVELAVGLGGEGAYDRLFAPSVASVEERLVSAAGVGSDSLVSVWRAEVLSSALQRSPGVSPLLALASLGWIVALAFLATRSTRWRSG